MKRARLSRVQHYRAAELALSQVEGGGARAGLRTEDLIALATAHALLAGVDLPVPNQAQTMVEVGQPLSGVPAPQQADDTPTKGYADAGGGIVAGMSREWATRFTDAHPSSARLAPNEAAARRDYEVSLQFPRSLVLVSRLVGPWQEGTDEQTPA